MSCQPGLSVADFLVGGIQHLNALQGWFDDRVECRNALSKLGMLYAIRDLDRKEIPWTRYPEEREEFPPRTTWVPMAQST